MALKKSEERAVRKTSGFSTAKKELVLQYRNQDYTSEQLMEQVRQDIAKKQLVAEEDIENLSVYVKPEDRKIYYVVNKTINQQMDLW